MSVLTDLAERLGGPLSPVRGRIQARVMRALCQQLGDGARDLAQTLDVSAATVSKAVAQLRLTRLVRQEPARARGPGRPVIPLWWTRNYAMIGVTIVDRVLEWPNKVVPDAMFGTVIVPDGAPFPGIETTPRRVQLSEAAHTDRGLFIDELERYIKALAAIPLGAGAQVLGCGVTVCGHVDHERGIVRKFYNALRGASPPRRGVHDELDVTDELMKRLDMTVVLDNDVTSLAVRANLRSPPDEEPDKYYILLAVLDGGVGGAVVLDGSTWRGANGMAAEPGHLPVGQVATVRLEEGPAGSGGHPATAERTMRISEDMGGARADPDTPACKCGKKGHVEAFAAPRAIVDRAKAKGLTGSRLASIDELAARPWTETKLAELFLQGGIALGRSITAAINWINPQRVLIYLPNALHETNVYLAGSFYLVGLRHEIQASAFSEGRNTPLQLIPTPSAEMEDRLAAAAAYLIFAELTDQIEAVGRRKIDPASAPSLLPDEHGRGRVSTAARRPRMPGIRASAGAGGAVGGEGVTVTGPRGAAGY